MTPVGSALFYSAAKLMDLQPQAIVPTLKVTFCFDIVLFVIKGQLFAVSAMSSNYQEHYVKPEITTSRQGKEHEKNQSKLQSGVDIHKALHTYGALQSALFTWKMTDGSLHC